MKQLLRFACSTALVPVLLFANAQKAPLKTAAAKPLQKTAAQQHQPVTDSFAYNIQTTVDKLALYINDPEKPAGLLTEKFLGNQTFGQPVFTSVIQFPGAVENKILRLRVDRDQGTVLWEWECTLVKVPKKQLPVETLNGLKQKIDAVGQQLQLQPADEKNRITKVFGYTSADWSFGTEDQVTIEVQFLKPLLQTAAQSLDSLNKIYLPGFASIETARNASEKYSEALLAEGFTSEKATEIMTAQVAKAAEKDVKIAYEMLLADLHDISTQTIMAALPDDKRSKIKTIAQAYLDAYNKQQSFDLKTFNPDPPVLNPYVSNGVNYTVNPNLFKKPEPEGKRVKCPVCVGRGQVEQVDYSHTYEGIFSTIQTQVTHWAICSYCGGGGWVTRVKK